MIRLLILGGSDAGISAALRAREIDPSTQVAVMITDSFANYSICGLPFYLSGEVPDYEQLAHRTEEEIADEGINLLQNHTAQSIDPINHTVSITDEMQHLHQIEYDRLVIATGAVPVRPNIEGLDLPGVYLLRSMDDSFALHHALDTRDPRSAIIIGGGYLGLEMADALTLRGLKVTVVEHGATILKTVDASLGKLVTAELQQHGIDVVNSVVVERIAQVGTQLLVSGSGDFQATCDLVLVAVGVRPLTDVASTAEIETGEQGALQVTRKMETNMQDIYAAGDCVETWHRLLGRPIYLPLGTTAHKQGRIAGENAVGGSRLFAGTLGTQVVKLFDLAIARTGLSNTEAIEAGYEPLTIETTFLDHNGYYPGARPLHIRMTGDLLTGHMLGAQMVGHVSGEVAKRIDVVATALFHKMRINELNELDLSYTPPLSSPWDPLQMSAQAWVAQQ